jgi:[ribosomal protein S18]-alanine N-acetyltransferase
VLISPATAADIPEIIEVEREATTAAHWSREQYERLFVSTHPSNQRQAWVVAEPDTGVTADLREKKSILGFLVARNLGEEWELENLVVRSSARRRGFGRGLILELIHHARAAGAKSIFLEVRESNSVARALYESAGFEAKSQRKGYYANPIEDAAVYKCDLM